GVAEVVGDRGEGRVRRVGVEQSVAQAAVCGAAHSPFDVDALAEGFGGLVAVEFDAVGGAVGAAVGVPEVERVGADRLAQVGEAVAVGVGVGVAGEPVGGAVYLDGVADEHAVLAFDDVGDRSRGVPGDRVNGDLDSSAEGDGFAAAHEHGRF